jgi:uncharacterized protein (TIGR00730 family)
MTKQNMEKVLLDFEKGDELMLQLKRQTVTVFGSARTKEQNQYYILAMKIGNLLAQNNYNVVTGGGPGIMEAANRGAHLEGKVNSIGLAIKLPMEECSNPYVNMQHSFDFFFSRKVMMTKYSKAFVIFPGGFGTLDELFEVLTLIQTKRSHDSKVYLVGKKFWQGLYEYIKSVLLVENMISDFDLDLIKIVEANEEGLNEIIEDINYLPNVSSISIGNDKVNQKQELENDNFNDEEFNVSSD